VNPMNFFPEVTREFELPPRVFVLDSTLRKMTETPGCYWTAEGAVEIARMADEVGVQYMIVNLVAGWKPPSKRILEMFEAVANLKPRQFKLFGTAWLTEESIDAAIGRGADGVDLTRGDAGRFPELYDYARKRGVLVSKTMAVNGRIEHVPPSEMARQINALLDREIVYVGIHENKGPTIPEAWRYYMKALRRDLTRDVPIVPHIHNMLGHATSATCAAVTGGAQGVDVAMNGIATDNGLAALEEVVVSLEVFYGVETGLDLSKLRAYSQVVRAATGLPVHPNKPLVGDLAYLMEYDLYVREVLQARLHGREYVHLIAPSLVGHEYTVVWGLNTVEESGAAREKLLQLGLPHDEEAVRRVNDEIRAVLEARTSYPVYLTEVEVERLARRVLQETRAS
jgi:isopropylmalate/homocitrate/citramalate synthase